MKMTSGRDSAGRIRIGYWRSEEQPELPRPKFFVDSTWNKSEREQVASYLDGCATANKYKGPSTCRFCKKQIGTCDKTDGVYIWPEGFSHYLREHNVKPFGKFIHYILTKLKEQEITKRTKTRAVKEKPRKPARFDDYCPVCHELIGWPRLSKLFEGLTFSEALRKHKVDYDCPHCDASLEVDFDIFFGIREASFE